MSQRNRQFQKRTREVYRQFHLAEMWKQTAKILPNLLVATQRFQSRGDSQSTEYLGEMRSHLVGIINQYRRVLPANNRCTRHIQKYLLTLRGGVDSEKSKEQLHLFTLATLHRV